MQPFCFLVLSSYICGNDSSFLSNICTSLKDLQQSMYKPVALNETKNIECLIEKLGEVLKLTYDNKSENEDMTNDNSQFACVNPTAALNNTDLVLTFLSTYLFISLCSFRTTLSYQQIQLLNQCNELLSLLINICEDGEEDVNLFRWIAAEKSKQLASILRKHLPVFYLFSFLTHHQQTNLWDIKLLDKISKEEKEELDVGFLKGKQTHFKAYIAVSFRK